MTIVSSVSLLRHHVAATAMAPKPWIMVWPGSPNNWHHDYSVSGATYRHHQSVPRNPADTDTESTESGPIAFDARKFGCDTPIGVALSTPFVTIP